MRCNASPAQGLRPGLLSDVPSGLKTSALGRARPVTPVGNGTAHPERGVGCTHRFGVSTSRPGTTKAHGTAGEGTPGTRPEPRLAGLFQAGRVPGVPSPIAVLEPPSPGRMPSETPGRRNIVLPQSGELNPSPNLLGWFYPAVGRKTRIVVPPHQRVRDCHFRSPLRVPRSAFLVLPSMS